LVVQSLPMSTPGGNVTSASSGSAAAAAHVPLLWIPYVLIALVFIVFLGANFWCYHKKHRERYLRKRDEKRVKDGLHERRRITALMRSHFQTAFLAKNNEEDPGSCGQDPEKAGDGPLGQESGGVGISHHHVPISVSLSLAGAMVDKLASAGGGGGMRSVSSPVQLPLGELHSPWASQNGSCRTSASDVCSGKSETSNGAVLH